MDNQERRREIRWLYSWASMAEIVIRAPWIEQHCNSSDRRRGRIVKRAGIATATDRRTLTRVHQTVTPSHGDGPTLLPSIQTTQSYPTRHPSTDTAPRRRASPTPSPPTYHQNLNSSITKKIRNLSDESPSSTPEHFSGICPTTCNTQFH